MKGDFSRNTFDPFKHYSRVLQQMGRVHLDADHNEQVAIFWHYLHTLSRDLIGEHGGPDGKELGFEIEPKESGGEVSDLLIGFGRYYVDGILCENLPREACNLEAEPVSYLHQPHYRCDPNLAEKLKGLPVLVYLDVWERHVSYIQDPDIRELALGGPDTATRAQVVWQVKAWHLGGGAPDCEEAWEKFKALKGIGQDPGCLRARTEDTDKSKDACTIPPESQYRGQENQLYRVEVHRVDPDEGTLAFKWSAHNGSLEYPIVQVNGSIVTLAHTGRDDRFRLQKGDWVEIVDDDYTLCEPEELPVSETLFKVAHVDYDTRQVTLENAPPADFGQAAEKHPLLRRWDQKETAKRKLVDGAIEVELSDEDWHDLEHGIQIQFQRQGQYKPGDYWQIPARTAIGDILWPHDLDGDGEKQYHFLPPQGVEHHYAPLAIVDANGVTDCRRRFKSLTA